MKHLKKFENFSSEDVILEKKKAKKGLPPWLKKGKKKEESEEKDTKDSKKDSKEKPAKKKSAKQAAFFKKMGWDKK